MGQNNLMNTFHAAAATNYQPMTPVANLGVTYQSHQYAAPVQHHAAPVQYTAPVQHHAAPVQHVASVQHQAAPVMNV